MEDSLKQLVLRKELEEASIYGFIESGINSGQEAFLTLIDMFNSYNSLTEDLNKAFLKQNITIDENVISLDSANRLKEFYNALLNTSLKNQLPSLYELVMEDYLKLNQAIELHLATHTLKGKINAKKRTRKDNLQNSEEN